MNTIPAILHQTSRTATPERRWAHTIKATRDVYADWQYELWTNARSQQYVTEHHPELAPVFDGFERDIMRADVIRYVIMHDMGGMYCDLDYEFIRPYDFAGAELVLAMEFERAYGDPCDQISAYMLASSPGHPYWRDVLDDIIANPPSTDTYRDVIDATGPGLLTRVYYANREKYENVRVEPRPVFSPFRMRGKHERRQFLNSGVTFGIHHSWGSWRERTSLSYLSGKVKKLVKFGKIDPPKSRAA